MTTPLLEVSDLRVHFGLRSRLRRRAVLKAVDGVSFHLDAGETLGLVGESGCGKSTTSRALLRLVPVTSGAVKFEGRDLTTLGPRELRRVRRHAQMVFQDPYASLDPRMKVAAAIAEPLRIHRLATGREAADQVGELLDAVGLPADSGERYPHEFSGGQRQRIAIARALAARPKLLLCDEPVSALDVSVQAQVLNLLEDLQERFGLTYLFVAHDLAAVRHLSRRIAVMYLGRIVEIGDREDVAARPLHPYAQALLSAVPRSDPRVERTRERIILSGDLPDPGATPDGCPFQTRCPAVQDRCRVEAPQLDEVASGHRVACHFWERRAA
ncbi:ABC transporter ATP-binding protein [Amycolatopsis jejuensis]|uniref:ABC transporter ATP-binding protein n=1 Tax=Amycolatopsis jejuensis TaxID=330084 RepID=UPI00052509C0|nr:oligopeptide/dipeptide ABC transporter ATP-binding protein [Amycolatopsis jejuensis]